MAISRSADSARAVLYTIPVAASYPTAQARYYWAVIAALFSQTVQLVDGLKSVGQNAEFSDALQGVITRLFNGWDAQDQRYRIAIFAAQGAGAPTVHFVNDQFKADMLTRLALLDVAAGRLAGIQAHVPQTGQSAAYRALDFLNRFNPVVGAGEAAVQLLEAAATIPGRIAGAALGAVPWGKLIFAGIAVYVGIYALQELQARRPAMAR
ncbi:MAG: hypothetical protein WC700_16305 [Gemmatimonadaceae bacterium]|jgi:hypothetical protein